MYRVAIVEDDESSRNILRKYIVRYQKEKDSTFSIKEFTNGLNFISGYTADFDIILMDIEMPHMNGMETAEKLRQMDENVCLIFVTNMAQYAIKGYEVNALDFIVKPVSFEMFSKKMEKAIQYIERFRPKEIVAMTGTGKRKISVSDIYYIEVKNHTLIYHMKTGEFSERGSIATKEKELAEFDFARCNNSYLVNLKHISLIYSNEIIVNGDRISIGPTKKKDFMQKLTEFMGEYV